MNFRICKTILTLVAIFLSATQPMAQTTESNSCGFEQVILDLAQKQLELLPQSRGMTQVYRARDPAYIILRYDILNYQQAADLFEEIKSWDDGFANKISELETTYAISQLGAFEGLAINGQDPFETFVSAPLSVQRAIILSDGGQSFFELLFQLNELPESEYRLSVYHSRLDNIAFQINDQSDAFKRKRPVSAP